MHSFKHTIEIQLDEDANAAVLRIADVPAPHNIVDIPITREGSMVGVATFHRSGYLAQIELLDARVQIEPLLSDE